MGENTRRGLNHRWGRGGIFFPHNGEWDGDVS